MKGVVSYLCLKWHTFFFNIVTYDEQIFSPFRSIVRIFYYNMCSHIFVCVGKIGQLQDYKQAKFYRNYNQFIMLPY